MTDGLVYRAFYVLIHSVFTVYQCIFGLLAVIGAVFVDFCHELGTSHRTSYLKNEIRKRNKIPKHLTLLLGREEPSYQDLANIVLWCLINQIVFLSFYDYQGILKKQQEKLEKAVNQRISPNDHVIWHNTPGSTYKNGFAGRKIHIKILSRENGKKTVANLARRLASNLESNSLTIETTDQALHREFEFPDPELALNCGRLLNFYDYPPWQIRVTEFLCIKSHHRIRYRTFLEQLYVYGQCEQRLGK